MPAIEKGFSLYKDIQLRAGPQVPLAGIIFDGEGITAETILPDHGVDKAIFAEFKILNPDSRHPLIDYLRKFPDQKATFENLKSEYPIVDDLFSNIKHWKEKGGDLFLSFKDMNTLFTSVNNHETDPQKIGKKYWNLNFHYNNWRELTGDRFNPVKIKKYSNNHFHSKAGVRDFLMYMLDRLTILSNPQTSIKALNFSKAEKFVSVTKEVVRKSVKPGKREFFSSGEKYGTRELQEILAQNRKIRNLFSNEDNWHKQDEVKFLAQPDLVTLFDLVGGSSDGNGINSQIYRKINRVLRDWKKENKDKFKITKLAGFGKNNMIEEAGVVDFILFTKFRIDHSVYGSSVYKKITLSADEKFVRTVFRQELSNETKSRYSRRPFSRTNQGSEGNRTTKPKSTIPKPDEGWIEGVLSRHPEIAAKANKPNLIGSRLNELTSISRFGNMLIFLKDKYFKNTKFGRISEIRNLTGQLIRKKEKTRLKPDEQSEFLNNVLKPLWKAVYGSDLTVITELTGKSGEFIRIGDFINLGWLFLKISETGELNPVIVFDNRMDEENRKTVLRARLTPEMTRVLDRARKKEMI